MLWNWTWDWATWCAQNGCASGYHGVDENVSEFLQQAYEHVRAVATGQVGGGSLPSPVSLGGYLVLTNVGASYDAIAQSRGLGHVEVNMTGVSAVQFTVQVNKIGTGTQSWQLWNETDATQVGVIADSGAAGNKTLTTTISSLALSGVRRLRVRALSSVAADDPVYYGASLRFS